MKKRVSALVLALALIFSISAAAATPRYNNPIDCNATLTVTSSGANCSFTIDSDGRAVTVSGTISLYKDGAFLKSWSINSTDFSQTYTKGITHALYRMDYNVTVKGPYGTDNVKGSTSYDY